MTESTDLLIYLLVKVSAGGGSYLVCLDYIKFQYVFRTLNAKTVITYHSNNTVVWSTFFKPIDAYRDVTIRHNFDHGAFFKCRRDRQTGKNDTEIDPKVNQLLFRIPSQFSQITMSNILFFSHFSRCNIINSSTHILYLF